MSTWQENYRKKLLNYCEKNGKYLYGNADFDMITEALNGEYAFTYGLGVDNEHSCAPVFADDAHPVEVTYHEFESTFDGNNEIHVVVVPDTSCACGLYTDTYLVVRDDLDSVIKGVTGHN